MEVEACTLIAIIRVQVGNLHGRISQFHILTSHQVASLQIEGQGIREGRDDNGVDEDIVTITDDMHTAGSHPGQLNFFNF